MAWLTLCGSVGRGCRLTAAVGLQAAEAGPGRTRGAGRRGDSSGRVGAAVSTSPPLERGLDAKEASVVLDDVRSPPLRRQSRRSHSRQLERSFIFSLVHAIFSNPISVCMAPFI